MSLTVSPSDPRLTWAGAVSLEVTDEWVQPWRIPHEDRALFFETLQERAAAPAGVRIALVSDTRSIAGTFLPHPGLTSLDLCCDGELVGSQALAGKHTFAFEGLPAGEKRIELWLPQMGRFRLKALTIDDGVSLAPFEDSRPKWVTYGSSISHCGAAESPVYTWPAVVARGHDLNLTCLGFGGNCHLEPMVARTIRDLPADFLSMCVGINIYGARSLGPRTFRSAVIGFVQTVREKHPETPYVVMSPIYSPTRETTPNAVDLTLEIMRQEVAAAVDLLRDHGDAHVHYVDGLSVFGPEQSDLLPDDLHPDAQGYKVLGRHFLERVARKYFVA